jgi:DNA-directed RNA polymerase specialized sigma24 family protein
MTRQETQDVAVFRPFPVTRWSLVVRAADTDAAIKRMALTELLEQYLPALRSYLRFSKHQNTDRADDLLQSFLASKVLDQDLIERADQRRGKFRTYLLTALDRFIVNQHRFDRAQKRSPVRSESLDEAVEPASDDCEPADSFEVAWARQVLHRTIKQMQQECHGTGRDDLWLVFDARVLSPTLGNNPLVSYEDLVQRAGFSSPVRAANALVTAKRMFVRNLRAVIGEYEAEEAEIDEEINDLHAILSKGGGRAAC